ncbi:MAG: hypothetical protein P8Y71_21460 [Pseudolabrys sp.]
MLSLLYPLDGEVKGYSREQFLDDLCNECEKDIRGAYAIPAGIPVCSAKGQKMIEVLFISAWTLIFGSIAAIAVLLYINDHRG